ncbi:MAG: PAS domain-containing protein [Kiritimatiellae bacterium]|nr:PAS domain-containing protein [Kiritimatiellia bacterium]
MNISENQGGIKFITRSIPGVIDGGKPSGRPVLTPVRRSVTGAPVKLKSVSKRIENPAPAVSVELRKPATAGLKVIGKPSAPEAEKTQTQFGLHARPTETLKKAPLLHEKSTVNEGYVKPKGDQRVLYYQLMNGLYDAVLVLDDKGHVVDCNERVQKVLGFSREDAWDMPIDQVIKGMNSQMYAHLKRNLSENHHILITARCYRRDGESFKGEIGVSTLSLTRENNVVFAIRNVDQRKSVMAELRKSAAAFEVALVPAFACNLEGYFTAVNQALMEALGIADEKEAKKVRFIDVLPDAARAFVKCLAGERQRETLLAPTTGGHPVKIDVALAPIMNGREVTGIAGSILQL